MMDEVEIGIERHPLRERYGWGCDVAINIVVSLNNN
jgi:hypothetical protein